MTPGVSSLCVICESFVKVTQLVDFSMLTTLGLITDPVQTPHPCPSKHWSFCGRFLSGFGCLKSVLTPKGIRVLKALNSDHI